MALPAGSWAQSHQVPGDLLCVGTVPYKTLPACLPGAEQAQRPTHWRLSLTSKYPAGPLLLHQTPTLSPHPEELAPARGREVEASAPGIPMAAALRLPQSTFSRSVVMPCPACCYEKQKSVWRKRKRGG